MIYKKEAANIAALGLIAKTVANGFTPDPGTSDLDDKQPIWVSIPLGIWRKADRLQRSAIGQEEVSDDL